MMYTTEVIQRKWTALSTWTYFIQLPTAGQLIIILVMTVLLGYIDCCIASNIIILVTFHYAVIVINALICL